MKKLSLSITVNYIILLLVSLYLTIITNSYYFKWVEEMSFFSMTKDFFYDNINTSGGLLSYLGLFFTQFYYYPFLGSIIFILLLSIIPLLLKKAFPNICGSINSLMFVPTYMLLLSNIILGYELIVLKSSGYMFTNTIGIIISLLLYIVYRQAKGIYSRLSLFIVTVILFKCIGFYAYFTCVLYILNELVDRKSKYTVISAEIVIILLHYFITDTLSYSHNRFHYLLSVVSGFEFKHDYIYLWVPFIVMFSSIIISQLLDSKIKLLERMKYKTAYSIIILLLTVSYTYVYNYNDENFRATIKINNAIEDNNWRKVNVINYNLKGSPTYGMVISNNLSFMKNGKNNKDTRQTIKSNTLQREELIVFHMNGIIMNYHIGKVNDSYRWCMEYMVEYGMRNFYLKYMAKCALLNEEYTLAEKYLNLLSGNFFYKEWTDRYRKYIDNPDLIKQDKEMQSIPVQSE